MSIITLTDDGYRDESGKQYDRVSDVARLVYLDDPFQFVKPEHMEVATARGSAIHRLTSPAEANQDGDEEWQDWAEGWLNFLSDTGYVELDSEKPVHSAIYQYAGTPDSWGIMPATLKEIGAAGVVEKKTTAGLPITIGLQTAPYRGALNEMYPKGIMPNPSTGPWPPRDTGGFLPSPPSPRPFPFTHRWIVWLRPTFARGYKLISEGDTILINGKRVPILSQTDWQTFIGLLMVKRWRERYLKIKKEKSNAGESVDINWR